MGSWFQSSVNVYSASWFLCIFSLDVFIIYFSLLSVSSIGIDDFLICSFRCTCSIFWHELLRSISSNKLVMVWTGGQISMVQALLEELPRQFLTFMRGRDIKPRPLHVAPTSAWEHFPSLQDVQMCWFCPQQLKVLKDLNH